MIMDGDGQGFFRRFLPDAIKVKLAFDFRRFWHGEFRQLFLGLNLQLAVEDIFAKDDAVVADIHAQPGNKLATSACDLPQKLHIVMLVGRATLNL